jgi:NTP pyrophosphatase (non-canonical NTP hydrolase)
MLLKEIGELRQALSREVDELRSEFGDLKAALKQQIEVMNSVQAATATASSGNNSLAAAH